MNIRIILMLLTFAAWRTQAQPHIAYIYPAGGQIGTTFQIVIGGQNLTSISNALVTGDGVRATVLERNRPMGQKEFTDARDRLKVLQDKFQATRRSPGGTNVWTAADATEQEQLRQRILKNPPNRKGNPAMIETVTLQVAIANNAPAGDREIRLASPNALSNPMKFCVDTLPEISRPAAHAGNPDLEPLLVKLGKTATPAGTPKYETTVPLPVTLNGQIMPGGVDRYRFTAKAGQQLVIITSARALIPYLADAVPGWFEATLTVFDPDGKELANQERFQFKPDPVLHFEAPRDGDYVVEIHDSIFRGREDFVYRLTIGELPFVTGIFPTGGKAGEKTKVTLAGWNLPDKVFVRDNSPSAPGITPFSDTFNTMPFDVDDLPECFATGSANSVETAQVIAVPAIVNGRIAWPGESDVFKFEGRAGQQIVAEIMARRLDSPLDSFLRLVDAAGKQLAANDDFEDKGSGLETHHADSYLMATLPADGIYYLHLNDIQGKGGLDFAYRLRVSEPRPDFALRLVPSSLAIRAGMSVPVTAYALRRDGFTNAIDLRLDDVAGLALSGARIPENQDKVQFTVKASPQIAGKTFHPKVTGTAVIDGQAVVRAAVPADDMMQAFAYRHLVPAQELAVAVVGASRPGAKDSVRIISATPVKIRPGGTARVVVATPANFNSQFNFGLRGAPEGISLATNTAAANGIELVIAADAEKVITGTNGNLIVDLFPKNPPAAAPKKNNMAPKAASTLPAIPFEITAN